MITIFIDGLAEPNPGIATYGYVIYENGTRIAERKEFLGEDLSNNYAEYSALVSALTELNTRRYSGPVTVKSDSQLLVNQMKGDWEVKGGGYIGMYKEAVELSRKLPRVDFEWIRREQNKEADLLSRIAYEEHLRSKKRQPGRGAE